MFESGALRSDGAIAGNDNDGDPLAFERHYEEIMRPDQVQIYETILGDPKGLPTTGLLTATRYLKDNRLLPRGFDKTTADEEIGVYGEAVRDADFRGAADSIRYRVRVPSPGQFTIDAELRYQPISFRWAHNLERYEAPEPKRFVGYYNSMSGESSVVVATDQATVGASAQR